MVSSIVSRMRNRKISRMDDERKSRQGYVDSLSDFNSKEAKSFEQFHYGKRLRLDKIDEENARIKKLDEKLKHLKEKEGISVVNSLRFDYNAKRKVTQEKKAQIDEKTSQSIFDSDRMLKVSDRKISPDEIKAMIRTGEITKKAASELLEIISSDKIGTSYDERKKMHDIGERYKAKAKNHSEKAAHYDKKIGKILTKTRK